MGRQRGGRDLKTCLEDLVALCPALLGAGWQETGVKPRKASCQREGRREGGKEKEKINRKGNIRVLFWTLNLNGVRYLHGSRQLLAVWLWGSVRGEL